MKRILLILMMLPIFFIGYAQEEDENNGNDDRQMQTLLGDNIDHGGWGALMFNYSNINDADAFLFGVRGGWMIDHVFTIGIGGYGFFNNANIDNMIDGNFDLAGGYGGLLLEATVLPGKPVHLSFPVIIGAGGVAALQSISYPYYEDYYVTASDVYFVIQPGVEVEFSLIKAMRMGLSVSYRYTADVDMAGISKTALNGWNFGMTMKFGKF